MEIKLSNINNTPVFIVQDDSAAWGRIYGAIYRKRKKYWILPAFHPFLDLVLHDVRQVYSEATFDATAKEWIEGQKTREDWQKYVESLELPVKSYEHQLEGLADILHNYRWILKYEMGCGKSKIVIDQISILGIKALVLCPLIGIDNWVNEVAYHSGGKLTALAIKGSSKKTKLKKIADSINYDVAVVTYDTARIHGMPKLFPKVASEFTRANRAPHSQVLKFIKRINDEKTQLRLAKDWIRGRMPWELDAETSEIVAATPQWLSDTKFDEIVLDESHRVKDMSSLRTKACLRLSKEATRRIELTGTLSHGDPRDLYPQLRVIAEYILQKDYRKYCAEHVQTAPNNEHIVIGFKDLHILNRIVNRVSSEKRLDDCIDLPERSFKTITFSLSAAQKKDYNHIISTWCVERPDADPLEIQNGAIRISKLLQLCSGFVYIPEDTDVCNNCPQGRLRMCVAENIRPGTTRCAAKDQIKTIGRTALKYPDNPKLDTLTDLLVDTVTDHKTIIWAVMTEELDDIERVLKRKKWVYVRVDGRTSKNVSNLAAKFNTDPMCRIYLAQISTGIMITLNAAKYAIYYSRDWSVDHRYQSLFRNYRIGQDKKTLVIDLCAARTLEVQQLKALESKEEVANLMTKKINCTLCRKYTECQKDGVKPWDDKCVLSTKADRVIAKARKL